MTSNSVIVLCVTVLFVVACGAAWARWDELSEWFRGVRPVSTRRFEAEARARVDLGQTVRRDAEALRQRVDALQMTQDAQVLGSFKKPAAKKAPAKKAAPKKATPAKKATRQRSVS